MVSHEDITSALLFTAIQTELSKVKHVHLLFGVSLMIRDT